MSTVGRRVSRGAAAAAYRRFRWSVSARAVTTIAAVLTGYVLLHAEFARFDAALARLALGAAGFDVSSAGGGELVVRAGTDFNVHAIVTGSCSSAAGVLGLAAVSAILLPGRLRRRGGAGALAAILFVVCNQLRICSILVLGWWLATAPKPLLLASLLAPALLALPLVVLPHRRLLLRIGAFLVGGLSAVLAYDVARGYDYLDGMVSYHALAGPMLTFVTLALGVVLLWRVIVGPEGDLQPAS